MKCIVAFLLLFVSLTVYPNLSYDKQTHHHHGKWEIGIAAGGVLLLDEDEIAMGLHSHLLRRIDRLERFSVGIGLETVFDEHTHFNTSAVLKFDVCRGFSALVSPGVLFLKHDNTWESSFSTHFEILYEFKVGEFHIGPVIEYSYAKNDKHLMFGLHFGCSF